MDFSHVKDLAVALLAGLLTWKLPALGIPIDEPTAHKLAAGVFYAIGKLQKSPVPSLAPNNPPVLIPVPVDSRGAPIADQKKPVS